MPRFKPLAASLFATSTNALNHCFVYFCSSFVFFTLSRVCTRNEFPQFESFDCAGREGKTSPKHSERDPRNTPVCKSSDHVSGGAIHASHLTRISNLTKIRSSLPDEPILVVVVPFLHFALTHLTFTRTHATLLSQSNLPKHLKWISNMCETQFFTPCQLHSTSGKVRIE